MTANVQISSWTSENEYLRGAYAPVFEERDALDLRTEGEIPRDLCGAFLRNGPNPLFEPASYLYPIDGTGMIHAVYLANGRASYRNRWVRTTEFLQERAAGKRIFGSSCGPGRNANLANTHIVHHAGRYLALWEGGKPYCLDRELRTSGTFDFEGRLPGTMSAHPKFDPETGEMVAVSYDALTSSLDYLVVDRHGVLRKVVSFDSPWPAMVHDIGVTRNYVVVFVCPFVLEDPAPQWRPALGTAVAVIPRDGTEHGIRWFEDRPFFHLHVMNAYERDNSIEMQLPRYSSYGPIGGQHRSELHRMRIDLATRTIFDEPIDDCACEFPRINDRFAMRQNRYGYVAIRNQRPNEAAAQGIFEALARYDFEAGNRAVQILPGGEFAGEPVFIPQPGSTEEDNGFLAAFVYNAATDRSTFNIYDARNLNAAPLARVHLPCRVPAGFHGSWIPDTA